MSEIENKTTIPMSAGATLDARIPAELHTAMKKTFDVHCLWGMTFGRFRPGDEPPKTDEEILEEVPEEFRDAVWAYHRNIVDFETVEIRLPRATYKRFNEHCERICDGNDSEFIEYMMDMIWTDD